jgi:hypothetical protein
MGKRDAIFTTTITTSKGNTKESTFSISLKNYSKEDNFISVQGSGSLAAYLEGAENISKGFTSHMLNLFADHPAKEENDNNNYEDILNDLRQQAIPVLKA